MKLNLAGDWPPELSQNITKAFAVLPQVHPDLPPGVVSLKLVDDAEIAALNEKYSGNAYPTDVLSFGYNKQGEIGDVVISRETAQRQADKAATDLATEVALLGVHGILHLLGHDHQTATDKEKMDQMQQEIMRRAALSYRAFGWGQS